MEGVGGGGHALPVSTSRENMDENEQRKYNGKNNIISQVEIREMKFKEKEREKISRGCKEEKGNKLFSPSEQ